MSNLDLSDQFLTTSISSKIHPYLYGCIFNKEDGTIEFLNNNKAYSGNKRDSYNVYDENDETNNENKIKYNKIKNKIEKRLELIYNKKTIDYNNIFSRKKKGGNKLSFNIPNHDYNSFYENIDCNKDRNYIASTRDSSDVKAIILCFFHINDFDVYNTTQSKNINSEKLIYKNDSQYHIQSEQKNFDEIILEEIMEDYKKGVKLYPVYIDVEYKYNNRKKTLEREYFLSDGNHRITALKLLDYDGVVPAIVCDYLPIDNINYENIDSKEEEDDLFPKTCGKRKKMGGAKRILKKY